MSRRGGALQAARGAAYTVQGSPWPYLAPPVGALVNLVVSAPLSVFWGARSQADTWTIAWRSALLVLLSLAIVWVTWAAGRARQPVLRAASMAMTACSCTGLWVLTFRGWTWNSVGVYVLVMAACCLALAVVRLLRGDGSDARPAPFGAVAERVSELKAVAELGRPKVVDGVVRTRVKMTPGVEFTDLQKAQGAIATLVPTGRQNVRLIPDRERPGEGDMEITGRDYLEKPPPWPGLSAPGGSIAEAIRLCVYGDGRPVPIHLTGDEAARRNAIGLLVIAGQPGAGKTELVLQLAGEILSRGDTGLTVIDARKGEQLPDWLRAGARVITDMAAAEEYLAGLVAEVPRRAGVLGRAGHKQWAAGCPLPFEVVILDEAAKLIADRNEAEMVELAESVRSVGILLVLVMQRVTTDRMPSSVKKARGGSICMGVADDREAGRVLSEATMEAGASPGSLGNRRPGCLYLELPGIPEEDWSRMARTFDPPEPAALAAAVAPYLHAAPLVPAGPATPPKGDLDRRDPADDDPQTRPEPADPELDGIDPREPIPVPPRPRISLADPPDQQHWSKQELMTLLRKTLLDAYYDGRKRIRVSDLAPLVDYVGASNLKPPRLSGYLKDLCRGKEPLLQRDDERGCYLIVPPPAEVPALVGADT